MKKTILLSLVALCATAFAAGKTFKINLAQDSIIEGKTFKAGEYKISMESGMAVIRQGKEFIEVPAREESEPNKVSVTELLYKDNTTLREVRVGGTYTKIVFEAATGMGSGL